MDISSSTITTILTNNRLIKGRLHLTQARLKWLYRKQLKHNEKIQQALAKEKRVVKSSLDRIKNLKSELKYCEGTIQKCFHPSTENIALQDKNIGNNYYIKARFYWKGQQREVQVGSIPIVLEIMKKMLAQGYLQDISVPKSGQMTWEQFIKRTNLVEGTKKIAALKVQEYIIRKLVMDDIDTNRRGGIDKSTNEKVVTVRPVEKNREQDRTNKKYEWYTKWRRNNL